MAKYIYILYFLISSLAYSYINIYPIKFEERIDGNGINKTFKLYNGSRSTLRYRIFLEDTKDSKKIAKDWVEIYPKSITLIPQEEKELKIFIKSPENIENGKYSTKLVVKEVNVPSEAKDKKYMTIFKLKLNGYVGETQNLTLPIEILDFKKVKFFSKLEDGFLYTDDEGSYFLDDNYKKNKLEHEIVAKTDDFYTFKKNDKLGILNKELKEIFYGYDHIYPSGSYGIFIAYNGSKYGALDERGEIAVPFKYDKILNFKSNYALVLKDGKFGVINKRGQELLPCEYDEIYYSENGNWIAKKGDKYINSGRKNLVFDKIYPTLGDYPVYEKDGELGIINLAKLELSKKRFLELSRDIDKAVISSSEEGKYSLNKVEEMLYNKKVKQEYMYNYITRIGENMYTLSEDDTDLEKLFNARLWEKSVEAYDKIERINNNIYFGIRGNRVDIFTEKKGKISTVDRENIVYTDNQYIIIKKENSTYEIIDIMEEKI